MTPPAANRPSTEDDAAAFVVLEALSLVFLAPELAFESAVPEAEAEAEPEADADALAGPIVSFALLSLPVCEADASVFEACFFCVAEALAFSLVAAARFADNIDQQSFKAKDRRFLYRNSSLLALISRLRDPLL